MSSFLVGRLGPPHTHLSRAERLRAARSHFVSCSLLGEGSAVSCA
jgi:hypothetical protein